MIALLALLVQITTWSTIQGWTTVRDPANNTCATGTMFDDTELRLIYSARDGSVALGMANEHWESISEGQSLPLRITTSRGRELSVRANGFRTNGDAGAFVVPMDRQFLTEFAMSEAMWVSRQNGTEIANLALRGSHAAVLELGECARSFR